MAKKPLSPADSLSVKMMYEEDAAIIAALSTLSNLDEADRDGRTMLINAAVYGKYEVAKYLLAHNANIHAADGLGFTALHGAVKGKDAQMVQLLLESGADANAKNALGNTPLFVASWQRPDIIKLLLEHGADPTAANNFGNAPIATFAAYPDIIAMFQQYL